MAMFFFKYNLFNCGCLFSCFPYANSIFFETINNMFFVIKRITLFSDLMSIYTKPVDNENTYISRTLITIKKVT